MPSIKDRGYRLPLIEPLLRNGNFPNSQNIPLLITGFDKGTKGRGDFVVKLLNAGRMGDGGSMRELLASFIAMEMELPVPSPAVVDLTSAFLETLRGGSDFERVEKSLGFNFATEYHDKFQVLAVKQQVPPTLINTALQIFAFDVLIQNPDRSHENGRKPNINTNGKELLIFDHELAFSFVFDLPSKRNETPWIIRESDKQWIRKHCLFVSVKGHLFDQSLFQNLISKLDESFWTKAWDLIPVPWRNEQQFDLIKKTLIAIVNNRMLFMRELKTLLL